MVVMERPRTVSLSLLFLLASIALSELAILLSDPIRFEPDLGLLLAFVGIVVILNMPFRDPNMPSEDISPVYGPPSGKLRTPEDNLTPFQYMTVSWMGPLIQKGMTRKMEDEDVWDLGWEFKHSRLHETFRKLEGSVTRRIFIANGMDALRTTSLNLLRLCASKFSPYAWIERSKLTLPSTPDACFTPAAARFDEGPGLASQCHHYVCFHFAICTPTFIAMQRLQSLVSATRIRKVAWRVDYHAV